MQEILEYLNNKEMDITIYSELVTFSDTKYLYTVGYDDDAEVYYLYKEFRGYGCSPVIYKDTPKELIEFMESVL